MQPNRDRYFNALRAVAIVRVVLLMLHHSWPDHPSWPKLLLQLVPIADPPPSEFGWSAAGVPWHRVTYLWLVLLLALCRRDHLATLLLPLAGLVVLTIRPGALGDTAGW
ncbi:hypothetical protein [Verrucosispora sp. TAA-831]|uniref:hypothetical protein n=1 Tax=Verrucosispora sp. TAA-831 TaxID=3422227 RepID=UPI003D6FA5CF